MYNLLKLGEKGIGGQTPSVATLFGLGRVQDIWKGAMMRFLLKLN